jgi:uncharacterized protein (DUF1697 family)
LSNSSAFAVGGKRGLPVAGPYQPLHIFQTRTFQMHPLKEMSVVLYTDPFVNTLHSKLLTCNVVPTIRRCQSAERMPLCFCEYRPVWYPRSMIYVALLRGINVGGKNKIDMKALKESFERVGMHDVITYINSGNIVFRNGGHPRAELTKTIEAAIKRDFGLSIRVVLRSLDEYRMVMRALPDGWTNDDHAKSDVMFLWEEIDSPQILDRLPIRPDVDSVDYVPGAVLWSVARAAVTRSGKMKLPGSALYKQMTIRNVNTTRKLYELMLGLEKG